LQDFPQDTHLYALIPINLTDLSRVSAQGRPACALTTMRQAPWAIAADVPVQP
jgi:hypothetical protein